MKPLLTERQKDGLATVLIRTGGLLVILVVVAIVVNIGVEALPLFGAAKTGPVESIDAVGEPLLVGSDPRREIVWVLTPEGTIRFPETRLPDLAIDDDAPLRLVAADQEVHGLISAIDVGGTVRVGRLRFSDSWVGQERSTSARWRESGDPLDLGPGDWAGVTANTDDDGNVFVVAWDREGRLAAQFWDAEDETWEGVETPAGDVNAAGAAVAHGLANVAVVDAAGLLRVYRLPGFEPVELAGVADDVAAVRFLIGGGSMVVAGRAGTVGVFLEIPRLTIVNNGEDELRLDGITLAPGEATMVPDDEVGRIFASRTDVALETAPSRWQIVRELPGLPASPTVIAPENRRRGFAVGTVDGRVALYYSTSGRRLVLDRWSSDPITALAVDPKDDGAVAVAGGRVLRRWIDNPHPETSLRTLFLPVWYEGYAAPKWVWQSTGGSDAFEPKLSL